jgi:hypothetical protein
MDKGGIMNKITSNNQIIYVPIANNERKIILDLAEQRGVLNRNTLMEGEGNASGYAGELIASKILKPYGYKWVADNNRNYDFLSPDGIIKIDTKCKGNATIPRIDFDCTVPQNQRNQNCTHYLFVRTNKDLTGGWIKGWISKEEFAKIARERRAGQSYNNAGRPTRDNHDLVLVNQLYPIQDIGHITNSIKASHAA